MSITKQKIEEYFGSLDELVQFYERNIELGTAELEEVKAFKTYEWFSTRIMQLSTNNASAHKLMEEFIKSYIQIRQTQIEISRTMIKEAKALYENN